MQDLSRIGVGFGEEMHFFCGAGRVCPGMGSVSGRKSFSGGSLSRNGVGFGEEMHFLEGLSRIWVTFGEKEPFWGSLSPNRVAFGEEMYFFGGSCSGPGHRAAGAAFRLSCGGCSERLAGAFASRVAFQHELSGYELLIRLHASPTPAPSELGPGPGSRTGLGPGSGPRIRSGPRPRPRRCEQESALQGTAVYASDSVFVPMRTSIPLKCYGNAYSCSYWLGKLHFQYGRSLVQRYSLYTYAPMQTPFPVRPLPGASLFPVHLCANADSLLLFFCNMEAHIVQ